MWRRATLTALITVTLTAAAVTVTAGPASAHPGSPEVQKVYVHGSAAGLTLSQNRVDAGLISFRVTTTNASNGTDAAMFTPTRGSSVAKVFADLGEEFSSTPATAAQGTRDLVRDAVIVGLASVQQNAPATVTEWLSAGTYYLFDINTAMAGGPPPVTTLRVTGHDSRGPDSLRGGYRTIKLTSSDSFISPKVLPADGTVRIQNVSDTIHMVQFAPALPGTTDAQVQAYFDGGAQGVPPFAANGPTITMEVQSPGRQADFSYDLPSGTYVLLCFIADGQTGMPHAFMGMHKVVILK